MGKGWANRSIHEYVSDYLWPYRDKLENYLLFCETGATFPEFLPILIVKLGALFLTKRVSNPDREKLGLVLCTEHKIQFVCSEQKLEQ